MSVERLENVVWPVSAAQGATTAAQYSTPRKYMVSRVFLNAGHLNFETLTRGDCLLVRYFASAWMHSTNRAKGILVHISCMVLQQGPGLCTA